MPIVPISIVFFRCGPPPSTTLFPYTTLFRSEADLEEERRLCYVGITRAEKRLFLSSAARRRVFGEYQPTEPSRFLDEIRSEEHTSQLQSLAYLVCRLLLEKKKDLMTPNLSTL